MHYLYSIEEDKLLFSNILRRNVRLLVGENIHDLADIIIEEFFRNLEYLNIYDWNSKDGRFAKGVHGEIKFSTNGHTGINMYGNKNFQGHEAYLSKLFSHEIWHALITVLNGIYGNKEEIKLEVKNQEVIVNNYSGFFLCKSDHEEFMVGYLLAEVMADILAHIIYEVELNSNYEIDDAFNYKIDDDALDAPYDDFLTLVQLFIASFSLDAKFSFGSNYRDGKGILNYYVDLNNRREFANTFINGMLINPKDTMWEYDKYMGSGEYITLLWDLDLVYSDYSKTKSMNTTMLKSIGERLNSFVNLRLNYYFSNGFIDLESYETLLNNFNELLNVFREEIDNYEVKLCPKIIQNIFKKLRR